MAFYRLKRVSCGRAAGLCALNWLVPGAGYLLAGAGVRGIALLTIINGLFAIGVAYGGTVITPGSDWGDAAFNVVAVLSYAVQSFHGLGWLVMQWLHFGAAADPGAWFHPVRMGTMPFSDLGSFHLIVAGGLNYAATARLWDMVAGNPKLTESIVETPGAEEESAT